MQELDEGKVGCGIFVDLKKAFDTVDHNIFLAKLEHYGICGVANDWFKYYLSNRRQFVSINEFNSNHAMLKHVKTWLSLMKQQLRNKLNMNWNEEFGIAKDENFWKTSVKDYPMQQIL